MGDADRCPVCGLGLVRSSSSVNDLILDLADGEVGGEVVESELGTSKGDAEGVGAIEGEEKDAGSAFGIEDVGTDIRFEESSLAGYGWESGEANVRHDEWHEADVGLVIVGMEGERFGDEGGDEIGIEFAVEEGKVLPGLAHEGALAGPDLELGEGLKVVGQFFFFRDFGSLIRFETVASVWGNGL